MSIWPVNFDNYKIERKAKSEENKNIDKDKNLEIEALKELNSLIGLNKVKQIINELYALEQVQIKRKNAGLATDPIVLHMVFKGNPGTGKTTVARILGKLLKGIGVLSKGHVVEVERADLVGEYIGHTAHRVQENVKKSLGGILFVDEAYSLARGGDKDFGKEAIDTLVKAMEDYKDEFILILAGYRDEMEYFLNTNPGLRSRFPIQIDFPDYTIDELLQIAELMVKNRQYILTDSAKRKIMKVLINDNTTREIGNARLVRNIIERAIRKHAVRIMNKKTITKDDLMIIDSIDIRED
ncbi:stage V sporulation protein K [Thermoanaerobacterium thermosaccharolyticum]|jgi:stage V sporulation protein K|uniref:Stage V sporulation protein K n=2 Tax=Thermoanaerobacterium thermosaccharolyticum TaxID=1517 RepID=D9TTC5_THETC|nr:stage V sporulation protein K [Thermoanaerobacterium thermosaccharolyticum]ADL68891.1 stage V sporulation protein K [Thermoanaerobacterium thermosaccharolyticum DSM 571]AGB18984.1 stage V sporulation protein K [Thermoanaerobacterium thermosaccharolyticum M0795]KAA5807701.1 stage V sporulation protein K [Thermoanaerobacterium thermosaccharolyticum]TCW38614.1 stage V sporulation protein K [Thermohydrogenium kirishiense]